MLVIVHVLSIVSSEKIIYLTVSRGPFEFILQVLALIDGMLIVPVEFIVSILVTSAVLAMGRWWEIKDIATTNGIQNRLLRGVQWSESGVMYSHGLTLIILLPLMVRLWRPCARGLLEVGSRTISRPLALVIPSLVSVFLTSFAPLILLFRSLQGTRIESLPYLLGVSNVLSLLQQHVKKLYPLGSFDKVNVIVVDVDSESLDCHLFYGVIHMWIDVAEALGIASHWFIGPLLYHHESCIHQGLLLAGQKLGDENLSKILECGERPCHLWPKPISCISLEGDWKHFVLSGICCIVGVQVIFKLFHVMKGVHCPVIPLLWNLDVGGHLVILNLWDKEANVLLIGIEGSTRRSYRLKLSFLALGPLAVLHAAFSSISILGS